MADVDLGSIWEPYQRAGKVYIRRRHNRLQSEKAKHFRACVGEELRGHTYRGHGSAEDVREARAALTAAAHRCSRGL